VRKWAEKRRLVVLLAKICELMTYIGSIVQEH